MKRVLLFTLIFFSLFNVFALDEKICIYPENAELSTLINSYMDVDIKSFKKNISSEALLTQDPMLLEYICIQSDADYLIIPLIEQISEYNYLRLFVYDRETEEFSTIYEKIDRESDKFDLNAIIEINKYLYDTELPDTVLSIEYSDHSLFLDCTNTVADVYVNERYAGKTPLELKDYTIPSIVKFCSEGFADKSFSVDDKELKNLSVTLIEDFKSDSNKFTKAQNSYYKSFALALIGWGSRIAVKSLNIQNESLMKILDYTSLGFAVSSTAYLGFNIFNYFKTTQNTAP